MPEPQQYQHMTISMPVKLCKELHVFIKKRGISHFIAEAVAKELQQRKLSLEEQYRLAAQDEQMNREFKEWEEGTIGDGLDETNGW